MLPYLMAEKLTNMRQQELLAEAAADAAVQHLSHGGVRGALAAALAALARRIDPAALEGQFGKLQLPTGDAR